jgi:hypothetical protein
MDDFFRCPAARLLVRIAASIPASPEPNQTRGRPKRGRPEAKLRDLEPMGGLTAVGSYVATDLEPPVARLESLENVSAVTSRFSRFVPC